MLFVLSMVYNFCNYLFHAAASRRLGPADYGALVSLLALMTVAAVPSQAVQAVMARHAAVAAAAGRYDAVRGFAGRLLIRMLVFGAALAVLLLITGPWWASFFHLRSVVPLWGVAATVVIMLTLPVLRGLLQGLQRFGALGANLLSDGVTRLTLGVALLWWGGLTGAVAASTAGGLAALAMAFWALRGLWAETPAVWGEPDSVIYRFGVPVLAGFGAYTALSSLDVILVKHFFAPEAAGYYSAGSMVGKMFLVLPFAVAQVLFPKASAGHALEEKTFGLLKKSLLATLGVLAAGAIGVWAAAPLLILTLFGKDFLNPTLLGLVRGFGPAMAPLALVYLILQYHLAVRCTRFIGWLLLDIPVLFLLMARFHQSLEQTLLVVGLNHLALAAIGYWLTPGRRA